MILVTGATGDVGRALVDSLAAGGHRVRAIARTPDRAALPRSVDVVPADLSAPETVSGARAGVDKLFPGDRRRRAAAWDAGSAVAGVTDEQG